jgi:hypothetical protein
MRGEKYLSMVRELIDLWIQFRIQRRRQNNQYSPVVAFEKNEINVTNKTKVKKRKKKKTPCYNLVLFQ